MILLDYYFLLTIYEEEVVLSFYYQLVAPKKILEIFLFNRLVIAVKTKNIHYMIDVVIKTQSYFGPNKTTTKRALTDEKRKAASSCHQADSLEKANYTHVFLICRGYSYST